MVEGLRPMLQWFSQKVESPIMSDLGDGFLGYNHISEWEPTATATAPATATATTTTTGQRTLWDQRIRQVNLYTTIILCLLLTAVLLYVAIAYFFSKFFSSVSHRCNYSVEISFWPVNRLRQIWHKENALQVSSDVFLRTMLQVHMGYIGNALH